MSHVRPPRLPRPYSVTRATSPTVRRLIHGDLTTVEFWRDVLRRGTPLVEPAPDPNQRIVTFLWRQRADTRTVLLLANKLTDHVNLPETVLERVPGTDVWHAGFLLDSDWRASYHFAVDDQRSPVALEPSAPDYWQALLGNAIPDPLATETVPSRWGGPDKSVAELPAAPAQPWRHRAPDVAAGAVTEHVLSSAELDDERTVWAYAPAGHHRDTAYPLLVLLDGDAWVGKLDVAATLDNLIAAGAIPPSVAVLPDSVDASTRSAELACREAYVRFLTGELAPWAQRELGATNEPAQTVIAGQSLSALTASFAGLRAPERFGNVLSQSGSYWFAGRHDDQPQWLTTQFEREHPQPVRFYLEVGLQEWVILEDTRRLRDVLRAKGYPLRYVEFNGGHDYACWRGGLADGLIALSTRW